MRDKQLARLMDITLVTNMNTRSEIDELIAAAKKYRCACVFIMPCYLEYTAKALSKFTDVHIGGVMGFPYGMDFTDIKVAQTKRNIQLGADELDMVMNLGLLLSGEFERVRDDIKACVDVSENRPVKCIIETPLLSTDNIKRASELVVVAGGTYVKTSTGFFGATEIDHVKTIKSVVGDDALIKAAGGVRTAKQIDAFIDAGANRFGIGLQSAVNILENNKEVLSDY
ncbi:MAG: deoxyribose-phosphate aldolase [Clostridia bacterium]|jgi:deoxyribose-phosphate aldolase|nr:deoxyribose-phosphate aldolase [Clostridia bacterium]MBT7122336.1 deoxyribose-phosphate aldolase [Clostridia bacterium]